MMPIPELSINLVVNVHVLCAERMCPKKRETEMVWHLFPYSLA